MEPTLSQALHLLNGDTVNDKIKQGGLIPKLHGHQEVPRGADHRALHPLLCRESRPRPSSPSSSPILDAEQGPAQALEDIFWALLNSREFLFNH